MPLNETITAGALFDGRDMHGPSSLVVRDGIVVDIQPFSGAPDHHVVCPGFVDLQMNGYGDVDCADADIGALLRLDDELASAGTTSYLSTLITDDTGKLSGRMNLIDRADAPGCIGIHLEGPFLGSAAGAHPRSLIVPPDLDWLGSLPGSVRLVTLGIEHELSVQAVRLLHGMGITVSAGHTRPSRDQWDAAVRAGASMVTHLFNAMSGVHHREFGLALASLVDDRVVTGLIADTRHVQQEAISLAFRSKPAGICLVSDTVAWEARWARNAGVTLRDGVPVLPDGTLAGSSTPLAECVRRCVSDCGVELSTALRSATSVPAALVGRADIGVISRGLPCDIVALDRSLGVVRTWRRLQSPRGFQTDD